MFPPGHAGGRQADCQAPGIRTALEIATNRRALPLYDARAGFISFKSIPRDGLDLGQAQ